MVIEIVILVETQVSMKVRSRSQPVLFSFGCNNSWMSYRTIFFGREVDSRGTTLKGTLNATKCKG